MKANNKLQNVWQAAVDTIKEKKEALLSHFTKSCGFGIGIEFRDSTLIINEQNTRTLKPGMVFNLCVGFSDLKTKDKVTRYI